MPSQVPGVSYYSRCTQCTATEWEANHPEEFNKRVAEDRRKNCTTCIHRMSPGDGCSQPDLYDLDNGQNEAEGTSAEAGEAIQAWRGDAIRYRKLDVVEHDEPCPGWEADA